MHMLSVLRCVHLRVDCNVRRFWKMIRVLYKDAVPLLVATSRAQCLHEFRESLQAGRSPCDRASHTRPAAPLGGARPSAAGAGPTPVTPSNPCVSDFLIIMSCAWGSGTTGPGCRCSNGAGAHGTRPYEVGSFINNRHYAGSTDRLALLPGLPIP